MFDVGDFAGKWAAPLRGKLLTSFAAFDELGVRFATTTALLDAAFLESNETLLGGVLKLIATTDWFESDFFDTFLTLLLKISMKNITANSV